MEPWLPWLPTSSYYCLVAKSYSTLLQPHRLEPATVFCPWDFPGKNIGVGCNFLFQGIFLTQGSNPQLLHILHWQKDWRLKEKGAAEHELAGWLHWLNAHESEQTLGEREGQENLVGCHPWGHKESDTTQHLNNNNRGSSGTKLWWHKIVMAQNVTELYTLERLLLCYINLPQLKKKSDKLGS